MLFLLILFYSSSYNMHCSSCGKRGHNRRTCDYFRINHPTSPPIIDLTLDDTPPHTSEPIHTTECSICLLPLHKTNIFITTCGHQFCGSCMILHTKKHNFCPLCRHLLY